MDQPQRNFIVQILVVLGVVSLGLVAILRDRIVNQPNWQVSVVGRGTVAYQPDIVKVTMAVQTLRVATAEQALTENNAKVEKVLTALRGFGIAEADLTTSSYNIAPQYDFVEGESRPKGYTAYQQLTFKVRKPIPAENVKLMSFDRAVATAIEAATKAGADQVNGISFDAANIEDVKQQARLAAIQQAKQKANELARASGVQLGDVVGWWENMISTPEQTQPPYYPMDAKGGMGGGPGGIGSVPSGFPEVVVEVNLNYLIER